MTKLPLALIVTSVALAACTAPAPQSSSQVPMPVTNAMPYYAGTGVVQNVLPVPNTAAAGGTAGYQRLEIRMDNGRTQYVDAPAGEFTKGMRVRLTEDKQISQAS